MAILPAVAAALFGAPAAPGMPAATHTPTAWHTDFGDRMQLPYAHAAPVASRATGAHAVPSSTPSAGPDAAYPRLAPTWARIRAWSRRRFPEVADTLNAPAAPDLVADFERLLRQPLPPAVRDSFALVNGQDNESLADGALARDRAGLVLGLPLLSVQEATAEWTCWRHVDSDPLSGANGDVRARMASCPAGWVVPQYSHPGWVPLVSDRMGNYIGVDIGPPSFNAAAPAADQGQPGQVIIFGRDFDTTVVLHPGVGKGGWAHFLAHLADTLEREALFTLLDDDDDESSDEEDYIGYEGYFGGSTGANAVGGGPASAHLGGHGFRLCRPYRGVSVLHALADQSVKHWEQHGLVCGISPAEMAWRQSQVVSARADLDAPNALAEHHEQVLYDPLDGVRYQSDVAIEPSPSRRCSELEHPLSPLSEADTNTGSSFSSSTSNETDLGIATPRRWAPPPLSSDFLALPTLEDVESVREDELKRALGEGYLDLTTTKRGSSLFSFILPWTPKTPISAPDVEAMPSVSTTPRSFLARSSPSAHPQEFDLDNGLPRLSSSHA